jgi:hypothetical protein
MTMLLLMININLQFITDVNDTNDKFTTCVNYNSDKLMTDVNDSGKKAFTLNTCLHFKKNSKWL